MLKQLLGIGSVRRVSFKCRLIIHHPINLFQGEVDAKVLLNVLDICAFGFIRFQARYHGVKQRLVGTPLSPRRNDAIQSQSVAHGTVNVMNTQDRSALGLRLAQKYGRFGPSLNPARFDDRLGQLDRFARTVGGLPNAHEHGESYTRRSRHGQYLLITRHYNGQTSNR